LRDLKLIKREGFVRSSNFVEEEVYSDPKNLVEKEGFMRFSNSVK